MATLKIRRLLLVVVLAVLSAAGGGCRKSVPEAAPAAKGAPATLEILKGDRWLFTYIDGDGQFPVEAVFSCFAKINTGDFDLVKTYRAARADGFCRSFISTVYNRVFRILFPDDSWHEHFS